MGGGQSQEAKVPKIIEDPLPIQSGAEGVTIQGSEGCVGCFLTVTNAMSTSAVTLTREYGDVSPEECLKMYEDFKAVNAGELAFSQFKSILQSGKYLVPNNDKFCKRVRFSDEDAATIKNMEDYKSNVSKLEVIRVQKISGGGGFSSDTKIKIIPSIPFEVTFSGKVIPVKTMTLYHPCPLRIGGDEAMKVLAQPDAVLSLNDPSDPSADTIILIPIIISNNSSPSMDFIEKIAAPISSLRSPNPASGEFEPVNISPGATWTLTSVLPLDKNKQGQDEVKSGYFVWPGVPAQERYLVSDANNTRHYGWRAVGTPAPSYIVLATPVTASGGSVNAIRMLPPTPVNAAIHPIPSAGVAYKSGICPSSDGVRERFSLENASKAVKCDPFTQMASQAYANPNLITKDFLIKFAIGILAAVAAVIAAYFAMKVALEGGAENYKGLAEGVGDFLATQVSAFYAKSKKIGSNIADLQTTRA